MGTEKITKALHQYEVVGIDTMAFIYHFEGNPKYLPFTNSLFSSIENGKLKGFASIIALLEVLVRPKKEKQEELANKYKFVLTTFPNLKLATIDLPIVEKAAELRANFNLRVPDAIQIATAIVNHAEAFITNDKKIKRISEIDILIIREII